MSNKRDELTPMQLEALRNTDQEVLEESIDWTHPDNLT